MVKYSSALEYHSLPTPGKISIQPTKPCETAKDLAFAYSPGVSEPCLEIAREEESVYKYTSKGNLVAVISDGTAVLGLGDIGPSASKPVMEGKGILFKKFADIDVFDIEVKSKSVEHFIETVSALAPTFGGINLEDIKAPECFEIEKALQERLDIPVFHDDQHGTAIIGGAAFLNALEVAGKKIEDVKLVLSGAGAAAIACAKLLVSLGLSKSNLTLCDTKGVVYRGRKEGMNSYKEEFALDTDARTLADALSGADAFLGLSKKGLLSPEMLLSMADNPIVFAMANPDPEIDYTLAKETRADVIMATGRSDFPNQVNNVLGFPFIFRGALDVRARAINEAMKLAAVEALRKLAKEPVPDTVRAAYGNVNFSFGPDYLIPKPFDPRVLYYVAPAVAKAAMDSGLARLEIKLDEYILHLKSKQNPGRLILHDYYYIARKASSKRIAFAEGTHPRVIRAAAMAAEEGIAAPVLIGRTQKILDEAKRQGIDPTNFEMVDPEDDGRYLNYVSQFYLNQSRRGTGVGDAEQALLTENVFANMMLLQGDVDGVISGVERNYPTMLRSVVDTIGLRNGLRAGAGVSLVSVGERLFLFADTTMNLEMTSEKLADVALLTAELAESLGFTPRVAMLSLSNFGSVRHSVAKMVRQAKEIVQQKNPGLQIEGEMHADVATVGHLMETEYRFSSLDGPANILIFPDMQSGNIAYKLLQRLGNARVVGPILLGLSQPSYVALRHATVDDIFNLTVACVARAAILKQKTSLQPEVIASNYAQTGHAFSPVNLTRTGRGISETQTEHS